MPQNREISATALAPILDAFERLRPGAAQIRRGAATQADIFSEFTPDARPAERRAAFFRDPKK
jgi:hypothetical protein